MTTMSTEVVARGTYNGELVDRSRSDWGRHHARCHGHRLRRRRRRFGARIVRAADHACGSAARNICVRTGFPVPPARRRSLLSRARRDASGAQRPRPAAAARRADRDADHLHHRPRRRADDRTSDEGWSGRVPDQAVQRRRAARRHPAGRRSRAAPRFATSRSCNCSGSATRHSRHANARCWRWSSAAC